LAWSTAPSVPSTSTGSGRLSIAAWEACQQLSQRAAPVLLQPVRHGVELGRELGDLVLSPHPGADLQVTLADPPGGLPEDPQGPQ
jgi:hypothetical protein